jgi:hypothetical protein
MAVSNSFSYIDIPDAFTEMDCLGVVCLVHREGFWIVVDCIVRRAAEGHFDAGTGATAAGKVVNDEGKAWRRIGLVIRALNRHFFSVSVDAAEKAEARTLSKGFSDPRCGIL